MRRRSLALLWLLCVLPLVLLVACDVGAGETTLEAIATPTSTAQSSPEPPAKPATIPIATKTAVPARQPITLTVWTRPEVAPAGEQPGSVALLDQLAAFDSQHTELSLLVEAKTSTGQGGALSYLRSGRSVAPAILPDLLLLPAAQLADAVAETLVYPLDSALGPEMIEPLYPAARALGQVDGVTYGYPYVLTNVQHVVYDTAILTRTVPATWTQLLAPEDQTRLIFPAASQDGGRLALQLYLAAGGTLRGETGQIALQTEPLRVALSHLEQGLAGGRILPESATATTLEQTWQIFQNSTANAVLGDVTTYQRLDLAAGRYAFAPIPGLDTPLPLRAGALLWVVTTPDPVRQSRALALVAWLAEPSNLAAWSYAAGSVPSRADALALWPAGDPLAAFLSPLLPEARPYPAEASPALLAALTEATQSVTSGVLPAAAAAEAAAASLNP
jgi:ABC-type glycerol-3-phosphate transport system substrate-binding protein